MAARAGDLWEAPHGGEWERNAKREQEQQRKNRAWRQGQQGCPACCSRTRGWGWITGKEGTREWRGPRGERVTEERMATSHHIMCGECEAVQEADGQPIAKLAAAVRDVGPVLDHTGTKGRRKGDTRGGRGNRGAWAMVKHAERALGHAPGAKAGPYAAEAMRRLVAGDLPPPASSEAGNAATQRVVHAILRVQRAAAQVRKAWRQASATETARRAEEEAHHIWVGITWGVWARNPDMRVNAEGEPTDAALEASASRAERRAADAATEAKRRRLQPEHSERKRRRTAVARSTTGGTEQGWSVTRALAEWKCRQLKVKIGEVEEREGKGKGTEAEQRAMQDMKRRVWAYEKGTAQDEEGDTTKKGKGEGEDGSGAGDDSGGEGGDGGADGRGENGGGRGGSGGGGGGGGGGVSGDDSGHEGGGEGDGESERSGGEVGGGENERGGGEQGGGGDDDGDGYGTEDEGSSGGRERSAQTATVKLHIKPAHAHGGKRDAVRETGKADSEAPSGKRRKALAETTKATNDGSGAESRGETGGGRGGGGSGSGEGGGGASDDGSGHESGGEGGVEGGGSGSEDGVRRGERGGGASGGGGEDNGDRSESEGDGGRGGGERRAPAEIKKLNISGRRRSRATEVEDEATHVADTGATGTNGGRRHDAKRRCAATTSATTAETSDAAATAARRADATNKRKERSRDEGGAARDGGARNTRDTRAQEHCQRHAKHRRKSEEASGRPEATSTQGKAHAAARERDKARHGTDGEEEWDSADEALSSDAARARRPDNTRTHPIHQIQTNPSADVIRQKLLDTAPERKESTQDASTHIQTASGPVATVLAGARGQKRVANYDEIGHRTGPRKKRTLYIADARQATGQLITEIQIGQRMLGIIESSARYAQAMEAAARQRQQTYDDG